MASDAAIAFIEALAAEFAVLGAPLQRHREANHGVLPYVFLGGDVWALIDDAASGGASEDRAQAQEIVARLAQAFEAGDDEVRAVIALSLLEGLLGPGEPALTIRGWLPEALA